jgi:hypothetical protein
MFRHAHRRITATRRSRHKYLSHNTSNTGQTAKLKKEGSGINHNAVNFTVFAGQCLSSGKGVAAVMFG